MLTLVLPDLLALMQTRMIIGTTYFADGAVLAREVPAYLCPLLRNSDNQQSIGTSNSIYWILLEEFRGYQKQAVS